MVALTELANLPQIFVTSLASVAYGLRASSPSRPIESPERVGIVITINEIL